MLHSHNTPEREIRKNIGLFYLTGFSTTTQNIIYKYKQPIGFQNCENSGY
jgi:hypothetical protein